jgi:tRNA threonylcarbamoyladenosine biosynthesis protein TsaE
MQLEFNLGEIQNAVEQVWAAGSAYKVWTLEGDMGAGKTTFIAALCTFLQVEDVVGSPTYSLINEYKSPVAGSIYHMDLYRLKDEEEALQAGVEDCLFSGNYCFVEWAEKAPGLMPDDLLQINIKVTDKQTRLLTAVPVKP